MLKLSLIDFGIILLYLISIIIIGFKISNKNTTNSPVQFLLGGRNLTLPAFVATLVSTWYGGILGVGEFTYLYGISNWLVFGVPYYVAAIIFAVFISKRARSKNLYTIPQQVENAYGFKASLVASFFVFLVTSPAPYILMSGIMLQLFFGWPLWLAIILGALFSMVYVFRGGFSSVIKTDVLQFLLMFLGFFVMLAFIIPQYGGIDFLMKNIPKTHFEWHGGMGAGFIIVWFFIALMTLVEPNFYQRCFAAKDEKIAKNGVLVSVGFWIVFDFLTTLTGLYARAILPNLENPLTTFVVLAQRVLPPVFLGLFITSLLAIIMSTVDSFTFVSAVTIGRDFLWKVWGKNDEKRVAFYTRLGILISTLTGILIAILGNSVVQIWKDIGSIATPALLIPVVSSFWAKYRMTKRYAMIAMVSGALSSGLWLLLKNLGFGKDLFLLQIEPIYIGILITIVIYLFGKLQQN